MNDIPPLLYLSAAEVRRTLPMADAIAAMKEAFVQLSRGQVAMPPRARLDLPSEDSVFLLMPCHSGTDQRLSLKCVTVLPANPARGLPLIQALVILADAANGTPLAILEGASLTAIRTGAASGAATDALARADASVAAIFGAGAQARAQLEAVCAVRRIRQARVYDLSTETAERFAREMTQHLGLPVERAAHPAQALRDASVVCTATTAREPVFADSDLPPGAHINAVGAFQPDFAEVPAETVGRARVVVDQVAAALEEAGDLLRPLAAGRIAREHFTTELGQVLAGDQPGRRDPKEITLFKSVGVAVQDLCAASRAVANARRLGLGQTLAR